MDTLLTPGQYAGLITDYLFIKTPLGIAAFAAGFLLSLWHSSRSADFTRVLTFALISLSVLSLIIAPRQQQGRAPVLFGFVSDMADAVFKGALYIGKPFAPHRLSFQMRAFIRQGIQDPALKERLTGFARAHYLPVLGMANLRAWPGDLRVVNSYSAQGRTEWEGLKRSLLKILNDPAGPWPTARETLTQWTSVSSDDLDDQAMQSLIRREISASHPYPDFAWQACGWVISAFPYIRNAADAALGIVFPFVLLVLLVTCNLFFLAAYIRNFIWVKSWVLGGALCHYASISLAYAQAHNTASGAWFWESPYYAVFGAALLCLMPMMTLLLIKRGHPRVSPI